MTSWRTLCRSYAYVQKLCICAKSRHWHLLLGWDDVLSAYVSKDATNETMSLNKYIDAFLFFSWMLMRYPISKTNRVKLVHYYYELCFVPGLDLQVIRSSVNMIASLLKNKRGTSHALEASELQLDWRPLWRSLKKEIFPTNNLYTPS